MIFLVRFLLFFGARSCVELYVSLRVHSLCVRAFWLGTLDSSNTSLLAEMLVDSNVKTNLGRKFLNIVDRCFPKNHLLHKTLNRNTLKRSHSCVSNMKSTISSHNEHVLSNLNSPTQQSDTCNCRKKTECPLEGKCIQKMLSTRSQQPLRQQVKLIHLIPRWRPINYSFVCMLIGLLQLESRDHIFPREFLYYGL